MSIAIQFNNSLTLLRAIAKELRLASSKPIGKNELLKYILNEYRKHQVTDKQLCRANHELQYITETYYCYLNSSRIASQLTQQYYGKGERKIEDTAKLVGLSLPQKDN